MIKLRIKLGECEFEAEGEEEIVIQQFEKFQDLVNGRVASQPNQLLPFPSPQKLSLPQFEKIFETDPQSSILLCRIPPPGKDSEAHMVLLLLLGYLKIRGIPEVSVLALKKSVKLSLHPVVRLDRILQHYLKDRFVIKTGRGKGGKYRLTPLGINKAFAIAEELTSEWQQT